MSKQKNTCTQESENLKCLNIRSWRIATKKEIVDYLQSIASGKNDRISRNFSVLVVRKSLSPLDVYCYLKARFGEPNGFQSFLRKDTSDNWIHWEFAIKADNVHISICGTSREIHFLISENLTDEDWYNLIQKIKSDYQYTGNAKKAVLKTLEKWIIFPNKFVEVAGICSDLHFNVSQSVAKLKSFTDLGLFSFESKEQIEEQKNLFNENGKNVGLLYRSCLELSLLTPVLAEAFINMTILILCKKEIKNDERQFNAFIRSQIDIKIFDLYYKCDGFIKKIDKDSIIFKNFKTVMDKRNHIIHGNIDPVKEKIETVYFDQKIPLFIESGDIISKFQEALERQHQPQTVVDDYINTYLFLIEISSCLSPQLEQPFWHIMEDNYPGYDLKRNITGALLPAHMLSTYMKGLRYDDELNISKLPL